VRSSIISGCTPSLSRRILNESHAVAAMRSVIRAATPVICVGSTLFAREKDLVHHFTSHSQESDSSPQPSKAEQQPDVSTDNSLLDNAKNAGPDCEFYNSFQQRFAWAERRNRCNAESGCNFRGRRFTGSCELETKSKSNCNVANQLDAAASNVELNTEVLNKLETDTSTKGANSGGDLQTKSVSKVEVEIVGSGDMGFAPPLHILINETLTSSAVDSIRDSRQLANELAKSLLIEVLERKENRGKFGELLLYLFVSDTVLSPTRHTIYWTLTLENTIKNIVTNVEIHRDYWLGFTENYDRSMRSIKKLHTRHEGRLITDVMLMNQVILWLEDPLSRTAVLTPLIEWTLQQDEIVKFPLTDLAVSFLPWIKVSLHLLLS
jgi:hypothetical protein